MSSETACSSSRETHPEPSRPSISPGRVALAGLAGAVATGVPVAAVAAFLLSRHHETLPPDAFNGLNLALGLYGLDLVTGRGAATEDDAAA